MSHAAFKIWPILAALFCLGTFFRGATSWAETPRDGTLSSEEATVLWNRARNAVEKSDFHSAAHALRRLNSRLPSNPHWLAATRLLGECELQLKNYPQAQAAFELYLNNTQRQGEGSNEVRTLLAETYLQAQNPTQALLIADQLLSQNSKAKTWAHPLDTQLQKVRALIALQQYSRAESSLSEAKKRPLTEAGSPSAAEQWISALDFQLRAIRCDALQLPQSRPLAKLMREEQILDRIQRHLQCMTALQLQKPTHPQALQALQHSQMSLGESCKGPIEPPASTSGTRTRQQQRFALQEIKRKIQEICEREPPAQ